MRFEIKSGGVAAILVAIAALSGAVFILGLLAGYDVGRESQTSAAQVATVYPVTAPPANSSAANPTLAAAAIPSPNSAAPEEESPPRTVAVARPLSAKHAKPPRHEIEAEDEPTSESLTSEAAPSAVEMKAPAADTGAEANDDSESDTEATRPAPPPARTVSSASASSSANTAFGSHLHHRPYNIQIQAAMDHNGASQMVQRLQALGYQSHLVPAQLNGQTWYKVVIGPYSTQEAAAAAQQEMRTKYNNTYSGHPNPSN
jgi:septal ring-binding cell division protein DamX